MVCHSRAGGNPELALLFSLREYSARAGMTNRFYEIYAKFLFMKVALLTDADVFAGTERHVLDLAVALRDLPLKNGQAAPGVVLVCPVPSPIADRAKQANIPMIESPSSATGVLDIATLRILRRLLRSGRVDILHAHNGRTALHATLAGVLARRGKVVVTQHFLAPSHTSNRGLRAKVFLSAHHWVNARVAHFIAISRAVADEMLARNEAPPEQLTTILNALSAPDASTLKPISDVRSEWNLDPSTPLIVCAARLEEEKSVKTLVAAMAILKERNIAAHCVIAGEGAEKDALQSQIESAKLGANVRLLGFRNDVLSLMNAGEIFVLPSLAEPFGLVILEAMALGKPVVATNVGGPPEIVEDDATGVLVPPGDFVALADALAELISDSARREKFGISGRARYNELFRPERLAESVRTIYTQLMN